MLLKHVPSVISSQLLDQRRQDALDLHLVLSAGLALKELFLVRQLAAAKA
jgi:hypothetical protein